MMTSIRGEVERTCSALEGLTHPGHFEIISAEHIRSLSRDMAALSHPGVNERGQTIKSPIDCFVAVPRSDPQRFVMAQFTLQKKGLRDKWIGDSKTGLDDGEASDISKAAAEAAKIRLRFDSAAFTVFLSTNHKVPPDLITDAVAFGKRQGLQVEVVEQSSLASWLTVTPKGQWLRRQYLGIESTLLSNELFTELGDQSIRRLAARLDDDAAWVPRPFEKTLHDVCVAARSPVVGLVGDSGFGKSTAALRLGRWLLGRGRRALWIDADDALASQTAEEAVDRALRRINPNLEGEAGQKALALHTSSPLLLIVDDINRATDPAACVNQCLRWTRLPGSSKVVVMVPAWRKNWPSPDAIRNLGVSVRAIFVPPFSKEESDAYIRARSPKTSPFDIDKLSRDLNGDPYLLTLWARRPESARDVQDIVGSYIRSIADDAASQSGAAANIADINEALLSIGRSVLRAGTLSPAGDKLFHEGMSEPVRHATNRLLNQRKICWLETEPPHRVQFAHDRIRDNLIVRALVAWISAGGIPDDVIAEPFFAEFIGVAMRLAAFPRAEVERVARISVHALAFATDERKPGVVVSPDVTTAFVDAFSGSANAALRRVDSDAIFDSLREIRAPAINRLRQYPAWSLIEARFRNGDLDAGLRFCESIGVGASASWADIAIADAVEGFGPSMALGLVARLRDETISDDDRYGAFVLIGRGGIGGLTDAVLSSWSTSSAKATLLPAAILAVAATSDDPNTDLRSLVDHWKTMPDDSTDSRIGERRMVAEELRFAVGRLNREPLTQWLIRLLDDSEMGRFAVGILAHVDDPNAVEAVIRRVAGATAEHGVSRTFIWRTMLIDHWAPDRSEEFVLGDASVERLAAIWRSAAEPSDVRYEAFRAWSDYASESDLEILRAFETDGAIGERTIMVRLRLADQTVKTWVLNTIAQRGAAWWFYLMNLAPIWDGELRAVIENIILDKDGSGAFAIDGNVRYEIGALLRSLDASQAEIILKAGWGVLKERAEFVQLALFAGTTDSRELARLAIEEWSKPNSPFEHIQWTYGFHTQPRVESITLAAMQSLEPYLGKLTQFVLRDIAEYCSRADLVSWREQHVDPLLSAEMKKQILPSQDDLFEDLESHVSGTRQIDGGLWIEIKTRSGRDPESLVDTITRWAIGNGSEAAIKLAAEAVSTAGDRAQARDFVDNVSDGVKWIAEWAHYNVRRRTLA